MPHSETVTACKKMEDYLHLYLGCDAEIDWKDKTIIPSNWEDGIHKLTGLHIDYVANMKSCKIHLRPLSDITDKECEDYGWKNREEFFRFIKFHRFGEHYRFFPDDMKYLLSLEFDLFELIKSGLAIDKTKQIDG